MDTKNIIDLISLVVGEKHLTEKKKDRIKTILELAVNNQPITVQQKEVLPESKPNEMEAVTKEHEVDLENATHFRFPEELNVAFEGQEGTQKMKIFPDGFSEKK